MAVLMPEPVKLSDPDSWPCREPKFEKSVVRVAYATRDGELIGTEKELANETTSGELLFAPDEVTKFIYVHPFQDDNMEYEIGDGFFVDLQAVPGCDIRLLRSTVIPYSAKKPHVRAICIHSTCKIPSYCGGGLLLHPELLPTADGKSLSTKTFQQPIAPKLSTEQF